MAPLDLVRMKTHPLADARFPWTASDQRAWDLKERYEKAVRQHQPRFALHGFLVKKNGRRKDPRSVNVFKGVFEHLDDRAAKFGCTAEELILAFVQSVMASHKVYLLQRPNAMLNPEAAARMLAKFHEHYAGRASSKQEAAIRQHTVITQATASLQEKAKASIVHGWAGLTIYLAKGRLIARHRPWWEEWEPWVEGVTEEQPNDTYRTNVLQCIRRIPHRLRTDIAQGTLARAVRLTLDGKRHLIPEDWKMDLGDAFEQIAPVRRTHVLRRHRRNWWDGVWGWMSINGGHQSHEFLWGVGMVVPMPTVVVDEAKACQGTTESVVGPGVDIERYWGESTLRDWHRDVWAAVLDPVLLRLAEMEKVGSLYPNDGGYAERWVGPIDPTPTSRAYSPEEATRLAATAPGYLP